MGKISVDVKVTAGAPLNYTVEVTIENKSKQCLTEVNVEEDLLTYTNVYFSTLSVDEVPVSFTRQILVPQLYTLNVLKPHQKVTLSYPIMVYALVDHATVFTSKVVVCGYVGDSKRKVCGRGEAFVARLEGVSSPTPRIGIVGGGLAGLTTAYQLSQAGYIPILYEGSNRLGGRCYSGYFKDGEVYEHGGELIDTDHTDILELISELGLTVDNLRGGELPNTQEYYQVIDYPDLNLGEEQGEISNHKDKPRYVKYTFNEASYDFFNRFNPKTGLSIYQRMSNEANNTYPTNDPPSGPASPWPLTYGDPALAKHLDSMTMDQYINEITSFFRKDGDGAKSKLAQVLKVAYVIEFGAEPCEQSPLNLIYIMGFFNIPEGVVPPNIPSSYFYLFAYSDETYHTHGGNSRIVERLLEELQLSQVSIFMNSRLNKIVRRNDLGGKYELTFVQGEGITGETREAGIHKDKREKEITPAPFDYIVSAIPFSTYVPTPIYNGWGIDISRSDFSDLKKYAIYHLGMSRNCKLNVQFENKFWNKEGNNGSTYASTNPYLTTPCGGDDYPGPQASMQEKGNPVGLDVKPVQCPGEGAVGQYERKFQNSWSVSRSQPQNKGILVDYTGGRYAEQFMTSDDIHNQKKRNTYLQNATCNFLQELGFLLPGSTSSKNFRFEYDREGYIINVNSNNWKQSPWQKGAYSFWASKQYIGGNGKIVNGKVEPPGAVVPFAGYEAVSEPYDPQQTGNAYFAGEQTAYDNQGYLDGAVESGNRVANQLLSRLPPLS